MNKIFIFSDTQLGYKGNKTKYLDIVKEGFEKATEIVKDQKIKYVVHLGDFYENRNSINVKTLNYGFKLIENMIIETGAQFFLLAGNHDFYYRTRTDYSSLTPLSKIGTKMNVVMDIQEKQINKKKLLFVPWLMPSELEKFRLLAKSKTYDICFGHFEIVKFELNMGYRNRVGLSIEDFQNFKKVYTGHFHKRQIKKNIQYVGSPYEIDFGERNESKGFLILDLETMEETFIKNTFSPKHIRIYFSKRSKLKKRHVQNNIVQPFVDENVPASESILWENLLRSFKPFELHNLNYRTDEDIAEERDINLKDIPSDVPTLFEVFLESVRVPDDINKVTLKKLINQLLEECIKFEPYMAKNIKISVNSVEFKNFMSFGNKVQKLNLKKGINLVMGPNGAGKTSLLETIPTALFGKPYRKAKKEYVVNRINKKECEFVVHCRNNKREKIIIERGIKPNYTKCNKAKELPDVRDYQTVLDRSILGSNWRIFSLLQFVSMNKESNLFLKMGKHDKRKFIEEIMDLTIFQTMYKIIGDKLRIFETDQAKLEGEIRVYTESIGEGIEQHRKWEESIDLMGENKEIKIEELEKSIDTFKNQLEETSKVEERKKDERDNLLEKKKNINTTIQSINSDIITTRTEIKERKEHVFSVKDEEKCFWCWQDISKDQKKIIFHTIKNQIETRLKKMDSLKGLQDEKGKEAESLGSEIEHLREHLRGFAKEMGALEGRLRESKDQREYFHQHEVSDLKESLIQLGKTIKENNIKLEAIKDKLDFYNKTVRYFKYIREIISDDQIKRFAISKIRPLINKKANEYFQKINVPYRVHFDEDLEEIFRFGNRDTQPYDLFSGGEQRRIDLILIFTFQDVLELLRGYSYDVLIFDEFLDSSLDLEGKKAMMDIVKTRQKAKNLKVFIITHSPEISGEEFSGFIKIEGRDGFSYIKEGEFVKDAYEDAYEEE